MHRSSTLAALAALTLSACARAPVSAAARPSSRWAGLTGLVSIPTAGGDEQLWLCGNGVYVERNVCGGYARGRWSAGADGIALAPDQVCLVGGYDWAGATGACTLYRVHYLVGCFPPAQAKRQAVGDPLPVRTEPWTLPGDALDAMLDGLPPPVAPALCDPPSTAPCREDAQWTWRLEHAPAPQACDPEFRPVDLDQLGPFAPPGATR